MMQLISPPVQIEWAGWRSDTFTLQRYGWDLSVDYNPYNLRSRLAMRNKAYKVYGWAEYPEEELRHYSFYPGKQPQVIIPAAIGSDVILHYHIMNPASFIPIDATPRVVERKEFRLSFESIFKTIDGPSVEEIVIPEYSVAELLEMALEKQSPKQKEIRERMRRERQKFEAEGKIINFNDYHNDAELAARIMIAKG